MSDSYTEVSATTFVRQFPKMKEDVREHGTTTVTSHDWTVGAFIAPLVFAELEELRRRAREVTEIEEADARFFAALDAAVESYPDTI